MNKHPLMMMLTVVLMLAGMGGLSLAQQPAGNLHDRAKQAGGRLVEKFRADRSAAYPNLNELARRSTAVVIGRALGHRAHLTTDGNFITTDFSVMVQEVVKGSLRPGGVVLVSLPGGAHRFEDGVTALLYAGNYRPAANGKTYVFFLDKPGTVSKGWELTGGIQGQFELDLVSNQVVPAGTAGHDPLVDRYRKMAIKYFLVELHQAAGNPMK